MAEIYHDENAFETTYYQYCRDIHGNLVPVGTSRRGGRAVPIYPRGINQFICESCAQLSEEYEELVEELCYGLNPVQRRRFLMAIECGFSNREISQKEGISREGIICAFRVMGRKNDYVAHWLRNKKRRNQHG